MQTQADHASQGRLDSQNARFWSELCGTGLARSLGISEPTPESLKRFDDAYFAIYPYLRPYVPPSLVAGKKVLEIGLGYGSLSQHLMEAGADYWGLDISPAPVEMVQGRMRMIGRGEPRQVVQGSALKIPFERNFFDRVVSIGCLHHTGNLQLAVDEVARVLVPGGVAVIMIYNAWSLRQIRFKLSRPATWFRGVEPSRELDGHYDANSSGEAAPHIDYTRPVDLKLLFRGFHPVRYDIRNIDPIVWFGNFHIPRERLLNNLARVLGLDLYVTAVRRTDAGERSGV